MNTDQIHDIIKTAENSLKQPIETFFLSVYPENHLVSHGLEHHRRVWKHAKELIFNSGISEREISRLFIRKIMIACYFHDIGMTSDQGVSHGVLSREYCSEFLKNNHLNVAEFNDSLEAIEHHDDKEYITPRPANKIFTFLSIADDLDAFGFIGIYRYSDIYLRRGIKPEDLGFMIRRNASVRYENLKKSLKLSLQITKKQSKLFETLDNFFLQYNNQYLEYTFGTNSPSGYCGVVEIFISLVNNNLETDFSNISDKYSKDPVITWFLNGIREELNQSLLPYTDIPPHK